MVKIALSEGKILAQKIDFRGHLSTFRAKNEPKSGPCKAKNDAQTTSEQLQTNFQKVQKTTFLTLKMVQMTLSEGKILAQKFDFRGHLSTFRAKNGPFKAKNNAQTTSEQPQTNFQKVRKTTFLTLKMVKMTLSEGQILT